MTECGRDSIQQITKRERTHGTEHTQWQRRGARGAHHRIRRKIKPSKFPKSHKYMYSKSFIRPKRNITMNQNKYLIHFGNARWPHSTYICALPSRLVPGADVNGRNVCVCIRCVGMKGACVSLTAFIRPKQTTNIDRIAFSHLVMVAQLPHATNENSQWRAKKTKNKKQKRKLCYGDAVPNIRCLCFPVILRQFDWCHCCCRMGVFSLFRSPLDITLLHFTHAKQARTKRKTLRQTLSTYRGTGTPPSLYDIFFFDIAFPFSLFSPSSASFDFNYCYVINRITKFRTRMHMKYRCMGDVHHNWNRIETRDNGYKGYVCFTSQKVNNIKSKSENMFGVEKDFCTYTNIPRPTRVCLPSPTFILCMNINWRTHRGRT